MDRFKLNKNLALVFDFDGTMSQIFKNYNLDIVILQLRAKMKEYNIKFSTHKDSFDVFEEIINQTEDRLEVRKEALNKANQILSYAELEAVKMGELVNGVDVIIPQLIKIGIPIGISTNNSSECVLKFLEKYIPNNSIPIIGRIGDRPELMKPNPYSILEVLKEMKRMPEDTIFIGDSLRDYHGSINAECDFIGMAPTESKRKRLLKVLPENKVVSDFYELLLLLNS